VIEGAQIEPKTSISLLETQALQIKIILSAIIYQKVLKVLSWRMKKMIWMKKKKK